MNLLWQNAIVIGLVAIAIAYVVRQGWVVIIRRKSGCGSGCKSCSVRDHDDRTKQTKPFVSTDELKSTSKKHST